MEREGRAVPALLLCPSVGDDAAGGAPASNLDPRGGKTGYPPPWRHENAREPYQHRHGLPKEKSLTCKQSGEGYTTRRGTSTARRAAAHMASRRLHSPRPANYALGSFFPFGSTRLPPPPEPQGCAVFLGAGGSALARVGWRIPRSFTRMNNSAVSTCGSSFGRWLSSG